MKSKLLMVKPPANDVAFIYPPAPWHTVEKDLPPGDQAVRELYLLSMIIEDRWTQDATTNAQDFELLRISRKLKKIARDLHNVLEDIG